MAVSFTANEYEVDSIAQAILAFGRTTSLSDEQLARATLIALLTVTVRQNEPLKALASVRRALDDVGRSLFEDACESSAD
jgi:hypothetical protein